MSLFGKPVKVPVIDVNSENVKEIWPSLCLAIKTATFIGVDTELSGLGDRKTLNAKSIDDRYKGLSIVAKSRSILSLGISCFKMTANSEKTSTYKRCYFVQTYNIMVLCNQDYIVEPASLKFLVDHSFDFNRQYSTGIPYYRGNDKDTSSLNSPGVRGIFSLIVHSQVPLVFHNAFVDLVFLYENFYANLPSKLTSFMADLSEMFPGGVFDTKYITDFIERIEASYLEYVFLQCQRKNQYHLSETSHEVYLKFPVYSEDYKSVGYHQCGFIPRTFADAELDKIRQSICLCFAAHGWCNKPRTCNFIHDVNLTISIGYLLTAKQRRNRKRHRNKKQELTNHSDEKLSDNTDGSSTVSKIPKLENELESICENSDNNMVLVENKSVSRDNSEGNDDQSKDNTFQISNCDQTDNKDDNSNRNGLLSDGISLSDTDTSEKLEATSDLSEARSGCHRAGFDAFMTASILSVFIAKHQITVNNDTDKIVTFNDFNVEKLRNKIYLSGKDIPIVISKSSFSKTSPDHKVKLEKLQHCGL